jgi:hypothetical protein
MTYAQFLKCFRGSKLGVLVADAPDGATGDYVTTAERPFSLATTTHGGGRTMLLAFADPEQFARRFGVPFNATIMGKDLLATVLLNPECEGVLVNSATAEVSIVIDRATVESQVAMGLHHTPKQKAWWQFW